ncbi:MAG: hypothetical protein ACKVQB_10235 [Bacteroidia bacterium]
MRKTLAIFILLYGFNGVSQDKIKLVNSGELLREGIEYHEDAKYDKAILKYKQIPENDTNYTLAIYELGLTYIVQKDFKNAIEIFEKAIKLESHLKTSYIQQLGNAYSQNKQPEKAMDVYRQGLREYPYYFRFYYEMGAACFEDNRPKDALKYLDSCLKINFFYGRAHYLMGQICERNDYFIPAILSYQMASYLAYDNQVGLTSLVQIQKIANGEIEINKDSITVLFAKGENDFTDIDEIIRSKSELDEKYKVKPAVNLPFNSLVKSLHLVNNRLNLSPDGAGWYYENLVPIYLNWWKKKEFPIILYRMAAPVDNEQAKKMYAKNKAKIEKHYGIFYNEHLESKFTYKSRIPEYKGVYKHLYTYKSENIFAIIPESEPYDFNKVSVKNGYYVFFHNNGEKKSEGEYEKDIQTGEWSYYSERGVLLRKVDNIGSNEFKRITYYSNGNKESSDHYKDGKYINEYVTYYANGVKQRVMPLENGNIDGEVIYYYDNGQISHKTNYAKGKMEDGIETYYHRNGALKTKINYKNGKREGDVTEFFDDGKIKLKLKYKDDKAHGNYKEYHRNGTLIVDKNFDNGEYDGSYKTYFDNGVIEEEANYAKGENKGKSLYYDFDGKVYAEYVENKGKIKSAIFYNKQGKKIYEVDAQKNELNLQIYNQIGIKVQEGKVKKDFRVGEWKFYSSSGALKYIKEYDEKGTFNGKIESYIVGDILDEKYEMKNNNLHGYYVEYFNNGNKYREGNYYEGEKEGVWRQYYINKQIYKEEYYVKGEREGTVRYFHPNGKIKETEEYKDGLFYKMTTYDLDGKLVSQDTIGYPYGSLVLKFANGKAETDFKYFNGKKEGKQYSYWANGNCRVLEEYHDGEQIKNEYNYLSTGKMVSKYRYTNGERDSIYTTFYEDGKPEGRESFAYDISEGDEIYYHENGKIQLKGVNKADEREGWFSYYSFDGNLQYKMLYHLGIELAYTFTGKDGKLIDSIPFKNASGDYTCYFQNGNISAKGNYVHGTRHGVYTKYFTNGKKEFEANYKYGLYHGQYTEFYENGKVKMEVNYENNKKQGIEKEYDVNGKLIKETTWEIHFMHGPQKIYSNGKLIKTINYVYNETEDK